ncbi:MAG: prolyl-tRNA synthetase associated domain-containing protein [Bacteroidales bacterium]|jgi:Ala-tRNA(Pro) deacylase|nr:prolyl-tRNA synthetase associated domain-containing protein [Bacteroidales bacterium]
MTRLGQPEVYSVLEEWAIPFEYYEHPPTPTIEEAARYWKDKEATYCKNLFFRNHKGNRHYLVVLECRSTLDIHDLEKQLKQGKISFASEQRMSRYLGLRPGSVSPFGLIHDVEHHVHVFFDARLQQAKKISFHPNDNRVSLVLPAADFWRYMDRIGNRYEFIRLYRDESASQLQARPGDDVRQK